MLCDGSLWGGSGVIIDSNRVITAYHVVRCTSPVIVVVKPDGGVHVAVIDKTWPDHDVARLITIDSLGLVRSPIIGQVKDSAPVCASNSVPFKGGTCGVIAESEPLECFPDSFCADTIATMIVLRGNSGSPVYNSDGELVGIVTGGMFHAGVPAGTGFISSLWTLRKELLHG